MEGRASAAWHACLLELRRLRHNIQDSLSSSASSWEASHFSSAQQLWSKAATMESYLQRRGVQPQTPSEPWDSFEADPVGWAGHSPWDSRPNPSSRPCHSMLSVRRQIRVWSARYPGLVPHHQPPQVVAAKRQSLTSSKVFTSLRQQRLQLLRSGDAKNWAKRMRPPVPPQPRSSPAWVTSNAGVRRRSSSQADVLEGALQDWKRLLQEPSLPWTHEAVLSFFTSGPCVRGAVHFQAIARAPPNSDLSRVGHAMLHPGPFRLLSYAAQDVRFISPSQARVKDWILFRSEFALRPEPCPGHRLHCSEACLEAEYGVIPALVTCLPTG